MRTVSRMEMAQLVAFRLNLPAKQVDAIIKQFLAEIRGQLEKGNRVEFRDFGSLTPSYRRVWGHMYCRSKWKPGEKFRVSLRDAYWRENKDHSPRPDWAESARQCGSGAASRPPGCPAPPRRKRQFDRSPDDPLEDHFRLLRERFTG